MSPENLRNGFCYLLSSGVTSRHHTRCLCVLAVEPIVDCVHTRDTIRCQTIHSAHLAAHYLFTFYLGKCTQMEFVVFRSHDTTRCALCGVLCFVVRQRHTHPLDGLESFQSLSMSFFPRFFHVTFSRPTVWFSLYTTSFVYVCLPIHPPNSAELFLSLTHMHNESRMRSVEKRHAERTTKGWKKREKLGETKFYCSLWSPLMPHNVNEISLACGNTLLATQSHRMEAEPETNNINRPSLMSELALHTHYTFQHIPHLHK